MHAGKTLGWAGATPLLTAYSRPKAPWGRSRPSLNTGDRVLPACIQTVFDLKCRGKTIRIAERRR
jgi:hypothetical protein